MTQPTYAELRKLVVEWKHGFDTRGCRSGGNLYEAAEAMESAPETNEPYEPYIIRAGDFDSAVMERQAMSSTRWTDQVSPLGFEDDELIVVRDKPIPPTLKKVVLEGLESESIYNSDGQANAILDAIAEHFTVTPKAES